MKKYKLLKDLPTIKAGAIFEENEDGSIKHLPDELGSFCRFNDTEIMNGILSPDKGWFAEVLENEGKSFEKAAKVECAIEICTGEHWKNHENIVGWNDGKKIHIADRDYYEILPDGTKKTRFTWKEAMEIEKKTNGKWRLPTTAEWTAIVAAFGCDEYGNFDGELFAKTLNLTTDGDWCGHFWSRTAYSKPNARGLYFNSTYVNPQGNYYKVNGFSVRCVAQ